MSQQPVLLMLTEPPDNYAIMTCNDQ